MSNFKVEYSQKNNNFYFILYFDSSNNFLFSNNYINFESHLTNDDIYGF